MSRNNSGDPNAEDWLVKPRDRRADRNKCPDDFTAPTPPPLNYEQTWRWVTHVRTDYWWKSQMPVTYSVLSLVTGAVETTVANMMSGTIPKTARATAKISRLIPDIESRKLVFPEVRKTGVKLTKPQPKYLWLEPEEVTIPRLSSAWSLWARCLSCGYNQFLPVTIDTKPHVACYHCLPPSQYPSIGATPVKKSLIHEALKKYC